MFRIYSNDQTPLNSLVISIDANKIGCLKKALIKKKKKPNKCSICSIIINIQYSQVSDLSLRFKHLMWKKPRKIIDHICKQTANIQ